MNIKDSVVLITGANRGLGLSLAKALLQAGARKVYAGARNPASVTQEGVQPLKLDVTSAADIAAAVQACADVSIVINNAGVDLSSPVMAPGTDKALRSELETNLFGPLALSQAFAPVLARNGGGAIVNILSALSWVNKTEHATYSITKAAAWSLTNGLRNELAAQNTQVVGVHVGYMDTGMTEGIDAPKADPDEVAKTIVAAVEAGKDEVLADGTAQYVKAELSAERGIYLGAPRA
jgi:NAD(P)-dependent dehydrogenase (short-subunit alcohol dehydrogenase family)